VRTTRAGIIDYFTNFLKLSPQGKVDQSQIRLLSPTLALHSGVYSFTLEDEGKLKIVQVTTCHRQWCTAGRTQAEPVLLPVLYGLGQAWLFSPFS
jgi:hypothetical protein